MAACRSRLLGKMSFHTRDTAIVLCVALVSVAVCRGATQQPETGNDTETELVKRGVTCSWSQSQSLFFSVDEGNGNVSLEVWAPRCVTPLASLSLTNRTLLQAECTGDEADRRWSRCNILVVSDNENYDRLFVLFSVREGVVMMHCDLRFSSVLNYTVISSAELPCQLTTLWSEGEPSVVHAACLHINASVLSRHFELYRLKINAVWDDLNQSSYSEPVLIFGKDHPEALVNFITNVKVRDCQESTDHFYLGWYRTPYRSNSDTLSVTESHFHSFTSNCAYISEMERFDRVTMAVLCPNQTLETIDVCSGNIKSWSIMQDGIPRSCSQSDETIVYVKENGFSVGPSDSLLVHVPTDNVTNTRCIQGNNTTWLIIESSNSSVTVLRTDDGSIRMLTANNTLHSVPVGRVRVWGERYIGFGNETHFLVLDITCLHGTPLYVFPFVPSIDLMLPGDISEECIDPVMPSSTVSPSVAETASSTAGSSTSTMHTPVATVDIVSKKYEWWWILVGVGGVAGVAGVAAVALLIVCIPICHMKNKQRATTTRDQSLLHGDRSSSTNETSFTSSGATNSGSGATRTSSSTPSSNHTSGLTSSLHSKAGSTCSGSPTDSPTSVLPVAKSKPNSSMPAHHDSTQLTTPPSQSTAALSLHSTPTDQPGSSGASSGGAEHSETHSRTPSPKRKQSAMLPASMVFRGRVTTAPIEEEGGTRHPCSPVQQPQHVFETKSSRSPSPPPNELLLQNVEPEQNMDANSSMPVSGRPLPWELPRQQASPEQQVPPPPPNHQHQQHQPGAQGEGSNRDDMTGQGNKGE